LSVKEIETAHRVIGALRGRLEAGEG